MRYSRAVVAFIFQLCFCQAALAAKGDPLNRAGLTQTFNDEFDQFIWYQADADGTHSRGTWATYLGYNWAKPDDLKNRAQLANNEEALYVDKAFRGAGEAALNLDPFSIKNGVLNITATKVPESPALYGYRYVSGMITTQFSFAQRYGMFEMRAKVPKGKGMWPAFWLLPADKSWPPEIDIMEVLGHEITQYHTTLHSKAGDKKTMTKIPAHVVPDLSAEFHTYAVEWGPSEIIFYFDEKEVAREPTPADMNKPFYILANLAVGGKWPGSPDANTKFPGAYEIDWIRAWKR